MIWLVLWLCVGAGFTLGVVADLIVLVGVLKGVKVRGEHRYSST